MEPKPTFLDKKASRLAASLLTFLQGSDATPRQTRWVRAALRYYVAPWDLIPDVVPGIGVVDDYLILLTAAAAVGAEPSSDDEDPAAVIRRVRAELDKPPSPRPV